VLLTERCKGKQSERRERRESDEDHMEVFEKDMPALKITGSGEDTDA
jgi:hypothetical protein